MKSIWAPPQNELILFLSKSDVIKFVNKLGFTSIHDLANRGVYAEVSSTKYVKATSRFPVFAAENKTNSDDTLIINSNIPNGCDVLEIINESGVTLHSDYQFPCVAHIWDEVKTGRYSKDKIRIWQVKPLSQMTTLDSLQYAEDTYLESAQDLLEFAINSQKAAKHGR
ncbi:hypothetical protein OTK49_02920 [Vibrio coralliirubri]|uniref:hypothetical protein n=1 Tax=Vibrio coralliirubri TaxID=1516159 RepID=UPI0022843985|nr:hypothetical protein [Vibrio coralliirubri]MCY9861467.1 hypothetical protein [Vibrio coralliirubri]